MTPQPPPADAESVTSQSLREQYESGATVPDLAEECSYSVGTVYRLLHQAGTRMRPKHNHGPACTPRKRP